MKLNLPIFIDPVFCENIQKRLALTQNSSNIQDLHNGTEYRRKKKFLSCPSNISFTVNTDGVKVFHSSTIALWPIWRVINELPPQVRYISA